MINLNGHTILVIGLGDVDFTDVTISESVDSGLFRIHYRTAKISFLTGNNNLYNTNLIGTLITISDNSEVIFTGVVNDTPALLPYNYEKEVFTIYADDYLTQLRQRDYNLDTTTISQIFTTFLPNHTYTPNLDIDITKTYISKALLTDTTITIGEVLEEICKLLNVDIYDNAIKSPLLGTPVSASAHFATTLLGLELAQNSAEIAILEDNTANRLEDTSKSEIGWGELNKDDFNVFGEGVLVFVDGLASTDYYPSYFMDGVIPNVEIENGEIVNGDTNLALVVSTSYWRLGEKDGVTYDNAKEILIATNTNVTIGEPNHSYSVGRKLSADNGAPSFTTHTIIYPLSLLVGTSNTDYSVAFLPYDYITYRLPVLLPNITAFKPYLYLIVNFDCLLHWFTNGRFDVSFDSSPFKLKYLADSINVVSEYGLYYYKSKDNYLYLYLITLEPYALFYVELYNADGVKWSNTFNVPFKYDNDNTLSLNQSLVNKTNVKWDMGLNTDGYVLLRFTKEYLDDVTEMKVVFKGIGNFGGRLFNSERVVNYTAGEWATPYLSNLIEMITDVSTPVYSIPIHSYYFDYLLFFAEGFLDDGEEVDIDSNDTDITLADTYFYWKLDKGLGKTELTNKINSLITTPTLHTISTDSGYLGKVSSSIYNDTLYSEVFLLATIVDLISEDRSILLLLTFSLNRYITFNGRNYRLTGFTFDALKGVYNCNYILLLPITNIEL